MKFEFWCIDGHPSRNTRELIKTYEEEDISHAEEEAYGDFPEEVVSTDTSHEDYTLYRCPDHITYELRAVEED